jgi:hypothetical protein
LLRLYDSSCEDKKPGCLEVGTLPVLLLSDLTQTRKHVKKDLQPYVCIFDACSTQDILYDTEAAWLKHERWEHTLQWCCDSADHSLEMFPGEDEFKTHMRKSHLQTFQEHQLQGLADASKRPSLAAFELCPLCGITPESFDTSLQSDEAPIPDAVVPAARAGIRTMNDRFVTSKALEDLQKHVARHLWHNAIIALPARDDLDEAKSISNTGSKKAKRDTFDIFDIPVVQMEPCEFVEDYEEPGDLPLNDNESPWKDFFEVTGNRDGEDLGLEKAMVFKWPRESHNLDMAANAVAQSSLSTADTFSDTFSEPNGDVDETELQAIQDWLSPLDFQKRQCDILDVSELSGTSCRWFLELPEFEAWETEDLKMLRCFGEIGVGKVSFRCSSDDFTEN